MSRDIVSITVECPRCGKIRLNPQDVEIQTYSTNSTYTFRCKCGTRTARNASEKIIALLRDAECPERTISLPAREVRDGPPISHDELLDFVLALDSPDFWKELT